MGTKFLRGDLYQADLGDGVGSEQRGSTLVAVVQNDTGNRRSTTTIVAAVTVRPGIVPRLPMHYYIPDIDGLHRPGVAHLEQLRTVDKSRLVSYIGHLRQRDIAGIDRALRVSLGLEPKYREDTMVLTLCGVCAGSFFYNPEYHIHRTDPYQVVAETCMLCNHRRGFDYVVRRQFRDISEARE